MNSLELKKLNFVHENFPNITWMLESGVSLVLIKSV